jgi:hypothetical protein
VVAVSDRIYFHRGSTSDDTPTPDVPCPARVGDTVTVDGFDGQWLLDHVYDGTDTGFVLVKQDFAAVDANGYAGVSADVAANRVRRVRR